MTDELEALTEEQARKIESLILDLTNGDDEPFVIDQLDNEPGETLHRYRVTTCEGEEVCTTPAICDPQNYGKELAEAISTVGWVLKDLFARFQALAGKDAK